jgi:hypothetical protein
MVVVDGSNLAFRPEKYCRTVVVMMGMVNMHTRTHIYLYI